MGYVIFSDGDVFLVEGSRYVGLVLFEEELDLFSPSVESSFWPLVLPPAVADLSFRPPLVIANGGVGSYGRFNLQKIWPMCFRRPLLPIVVEYYAPLLRSPRLWSLLLVEITILVAGFGEVPWRWNFLKQWTSSDARKMKNRDPVACLNVILFYVEVLVVKEILF